MVLKTIALDTEYDLLIFSDRLVAVEHNDIIRRVSIGTDSFNESRRIHSKLLDHPSAQRQETRVATLLPDWKLEATVTGHFPITWVEWLSGLVERVLEGEVVMSPRDRLIMALSFMPQPCDVSAVEIQ